ncbi:hypothetical protein F4801DRAFT_129123 [Xylaria longipes]|nr:hypothetical protein F4801DRAFT_129123 [Xylaria longipes]RYC64270.1 hypothetical protein CHU98_g1939 [Xylaria longipes]
MPLPDSSAKQTCLKALLGSGLFLSSCDGASLVQNTVGIISTPFSTLTSTITITTTILYRPSLVPGNSQYTLVGCYSQPSGDTERIFRSDEYDVYLDKGPPGEDTVEDCFRSCGSTSPLSNRPEHYLYAGVRNGSECICGVQLSTNAHKLSVDDCIRPCLGGPRLSCGGQNNVAVYSLISGDGMHKQTSQNGGSSNFMISETKQPTLTRSLTTSTINTQGQGAPFQTAETLHHSSASGKPVSTPTIAVITGSLSGAIIIAAGLFLCYRVKRKKRLRDSHVKSMLERRGQRSVPSLFLTRAHIPSSVTDLAATDHKHSNDRDSSSSRTDDHARDFRVTADGDLVRSTPALESRTDRAGASSAVQWRPSNANGSVFPMQFTAHERTSSSSLTTPPSSAKVDGLGERAWHRRKLSTPYQPPVSAGLAVGVASGASTTSTRGNMARSGLPSSPPGWLPPSPPLRPGVRERSQRRLQSKSITTPDWPRNTKATVRNLPPARPRRSFDTIIFEPEPGNDDGQDVLSAAGTGGGSRVGNVNTPALGIYGSLSRPNQANTESPILGWRAASREDGLAHRQPTIPVLPPVAPGEKFDHKRWRGTLYAQPYESNESQKRLERGRQQCRGDEGSPVSASSTGTSILFSHQEFDRRL